MILTKELIGLRIEWLREQALYILRVPEEERCEREREWLRWAERRVHALQKEVAA